MTAARCTCFVLLACVAGTPALWAQASEQRQPVPGPEAQKQAQELVAKVYRQQYQAATDSAGKIALAKELIDRAGKNTEDATTHYVLLRAAEKIAAQGGVAFRLRSDAWYRQVDTRRTSVLTRAKVEKRLTEIAQVGIDIQVENGHPPSPAVAPFDAKQAKEYQRSWAEHLKVPVVETNSIGMKLVLIPPGQFDMGSSKEEIDEIVRRARAGSWGQWFSDTVPTEGPRHRVKITKPFRAGLFEVTVGQFRKFVDATGYRTDAERDGRGGSGYFGPVGQQQWQQRPEFTWRSPGFRQTDDHPVVEVTYADAVAFCRWLSKKEGRTYRLPTEAEWEYACRAGTATPHYFGDKESALGRHAWWTKNSSRTAQPVGRKPPNPWGLHDVLGNAWEWCADWYAADYYRRSPSGDPPGPASGVYRVARGASWDEERPASFRSTYRYHDCNPRDASSRVGFRAVRVIGP